MKFVKVSVFAAALICANFALTSFASAQIVALGASNVEGYGVNPSEAWPAQLESMLRAKGSGAHITNAGVFGDTTGQVLARLSSAVPEGTKVCAVEIPSAMSPVEQSRKSRINFFAPCFSNCVSFSRICLVVPASNPCTRR